MPSSPLFWAALSVAAAGLVLVSVLAPYALTRLARERKAQAQPR